jgi:Tetratricopeptide repeat
MRNLILSMLIGLSLSTIAYAEMRDIRILGTPEGVVLGISFDEEPLAITVTPDETGARLLVEGVTSQGIMLSPMRNDVVSQIEVTPIEGGVIVQLWALQNWSAITGQIEGRSGLVTIMTDGAPIMANTADPADEIIPPQEMAEIAVPSQTPPVPDVAADVEVAAPVESAPTAGDVADNDDMAAVSPAASTGCASQADTVAMSPWDLDALTALAQCHVDDNRPSEARPHLERVLAFEPGRFDAAILLAEVAEREGAIDEARALYDQAAGSARSDGQAAAARARGRALSPDD